jgi:hypothetical protein
MISFPAALVGVPGTGGVAILLYAIDRHTFGSGLLERGQSGDFSVEYGYALAYEHVAQLLAIGAGLGRHHGEQYPVGLVHEAVQLGERMSQTVRCDALRDGGNHQQVAVGSQVFEIIVGRVAFRVDDHMAVFVFVNVVNELRMGDDLEGQSGIAAALAPSGGAADGVAVHQQGRGEALQIGLDPTVVSPAAIWAMVFSFCLSVDHAPPTIET